MQLAVPVLQAAVAAPATRGPRQQFTQVPAPLSIQGAATCRADTGLMCVVILTPALCVQAAQAAAATDDYEAAINRTAQELYAALDSAMEAKS